MEPVENLFHRVCLAFLHMAKQIYVPCSTLFSMIRERKILFYNTSSTFVKRTFSGFLILFIYLFVIIAGNGVFATFITLAVGLATMESFDMLEKLKTNEEKRLWKRIFLAYVLTTFVPLIFIRFSSQGLHILLWLFTTISSLDTFAYIFGRIFGRTPICPNISPNKTVAGSIGGSIVAFIVSILFYRVFTPQDVSRIQSLFFVVLTLYVIFFAQFGDLLQSKIKRQFGVKDFGSSIPGHGGIMDRMDSFIVVAPSVLLISWLSGGVLF